ncbi:MULTISPECIES: hypothetical protein [unclassified Streptomyces]|uniref:hypothetical protein n=1 Tax=unclassified Streptomyces TaxID=2593676 RepID=UPI00131C62A0|nr:hypothetical protein [Streptomyces sp. CB01635]
MDSKAPQGAERLGSPPRTSELVRMAEDASTSASMASALVRAALDKDVVADRLDHAA